MHPILVIEPLVGTLLGIYNCLYWVPVHTKIVVESLASSLSYLIVSIRYLCIPYWLSSPSSEPFWVHTIVSIGYLCTLK